MSHINATETRIILDNGGGITLQLNGWAHHYDYEGAAATDIREWIATKDTSLWDGHEDDALDCEPTDEQIRNGGYRIIEIGEHDNTKDVFDRLVKLGWGNADALAGSLLGVK